MLHNIIKLLLAIDGKLLTLGLKLNVDIACLKDREI